MLHISNYNYNLPSGADLAPKTIVTSPQRIFVYGGEAHSPLQEWTYDLWSSFDSLEEAQAFINKWDTLTMGDFYELIRDEKI